MSDFFQVHHDGDDKNSDTSFALLFDDCKDISPLEGSKDKADVALIGNENTELPDALAPGESYEQAH